MYRSYNGNTFYWDIVYIVLRISLIVVNLVFNEYDVQKLSLSLIILFIFLFAEIRYRPYNHTFTQKLSVQSTGTQILTLLSALFLSNNNNSQTMLYLIQIPILIVNLRLLLKFFELIF